MAGQAHVVGAVAHAGEHGSGVHRLDLHFDAYGLQVLLDQRREAGPLAGAGQGEGLAVVAALGHQCLGPGGVIGAGDGGRGIGRVRQDTGAGHRTAGAGALLAEQLLVQGLVDGLAQVHAVDGGAVEHQLIEVRGGGPLFHGEARLFGHGLVLLGDVAAKSVVIQIAGDEGGEQIALVHHGDGQGIEAGGAQLIVLVGLQHQIAAGDLGDELAGAGANGLAPEIALHHLVGGDVLQQVGGQDVDVSVLIHQEFLRDGGLLEAQLLRVVVYGLHPQGLPGHGCAGVVRAGQAGQGRLAQDLAGGVGDELEGLHPMLGGDGGTVVEGGLLVQGEHDGVAVLGALPFLRRPGQAGAVGLDVGQAIIDLVVNDAGIVAAGYAVIGHQGVPGVGQAVVDVHALRRLLGLVTGLRLVAGGLGTAAGQDQAAQQHSGQGQGRQTAKHTSLFLHGNLILLVAV